MFELHPQLAADSVLLGRLPLCQVRLSRDSRYPWLILIPEMAGVREIHQLPPEARVQLLAESCQVAELMEQITSADKMNVAALGNMVPQLHLHHVARFQDDDAWPAPIWGKHPARPYEAEALTAAATSWRHHLASLDQFNPAQDGQ
ncbi:HIT domain-containing protein [Ferrimonas marina]|uniref:Diadenosine tetraphosphate (Ap4A) hydrolase n=1 Tax=Ferrimonas marina TaxID=299255 RepID=A0A1M5VQS1_9GAMM|nr:HIT domain-containing protein [Ferrimonas marina]SHH77595.1 Diadenosine tetraphosphate (Ap4A) hydrolase [Ferrimonas marina]